METRDELWIRESLQRAIVLVQQGQPNEAERVLDETLLRAEECDKQSAITGLVLLDLHSFYENQNRHHEAARAWERIRIILASATVSLSVTEH